MPINSLSVNSVFSNEVGERKKPLSLAESAELQFLVLLRDRKGSFSLTSVASSEASEIKMSLTEYAETSEIKDIEECIYME
jgi:hypothetical protein